VAASARARARARKPRRPAPLPPPSRALYSPSPPTMPRTAAILKKVATESRARPVQDKCANARGARAASSAPVVARPRARRREVSMDSLDE